MECKDRYLQEEEKYVNLPPLKQKKTIQIANSVCRQKKIEYLKLPELEGRKEERQQVGEKQLSNKSCCPLISKPQVTSAGSRKFKKNIVSPQLSNVDTRTPQRQPLPKKEKLGLGFHIRKQWLAESLENLKIKNSKELRKKVLGWLNERLKSVKRYVYKPLRESLGVWLLDAWLNFQKQYPEEFEGDIDDWVKISLHHFALEGPDTSLLTPQEWLETSIQAILNLRKRETTSEIALRKRRLQKSLEKLRF